MERRLRSWHLQVSPTEAHGLYCGTSTASSQLGLRMCTHVFLGLHCTHEYDKDGLDDLKLGSWGFSIALPITVGKHHACRRIHLGRSASFALLAWQAVLVEQLRGQVWATPIQRAARVVFCQSIPIYLKAVEPCSSKESPSSPSVWPSLWEVGFPQNKLVLSMRASHCVVVVYTTSHVHVYPSSGWHVNGVACYRPAYIWDVHDLLPLMIFDIILCLWDSIGNMIRSLLKEGIRQCIGQELLGLSDFHIFKWFCIYRHLFPKYRVALDYFYLNHIIKSKAPHN